MSTHPALPAALWRERLFSRPPEDDDAFDALSRELFAFQFAANAPFRRLCEARGVLPENPPHWRELPALPTTAFKDLEVTCLPPPERQRVFHSSGTTSQSPSRHFHSAESLTLYEAALRPWFAHHLLADGFRGQFLSLTPRGAEAPHSSLVHMLETIAPKAGGTAECFVGRVGSDGAWELDAERAESSLQSAIRENRPVLLLGTAFSFVLLLDHLATAGRTLLLPVGSRAMETGGYKGRSRALPREELHALMTNRLGLPPDFIVAEYGMSELSSQAYDHHAGAPAIGPRVFCFPPWARALVISPETGNEVGDGGVGLLRVIDLANAFSVVALQTEDLVIKMGKGFQILGRAANAPPRGCSLLPADTRAHP